MTEQQAAGMGYRFLWDPDILGNLDQFAEERERIRNMKQVVGELGGIELDVSEGAKRKALLDAYKKRLARYEELVTTKRKEAADNFYSAQYRVFNPGKNELPRFTQLLMQFDAIKEPEDLRHQMDRLYEVGDDVACKALLRRGVELGANSVVERFYSYYPDQQKHYDEYRQAYETQQQLNSTKPPGAPSLPEELETPEGRTLMHQQEQAERVARENAAFGAGDNGGQPAS